ncbi:Zinc finger domain protein 2A [Triplophysa tibetana]|uniref:Zinc finger domain protein 2A n=1 Tax=Triplophysa tibetana TaxID=1572043 RepID=A0A5A9NA63_9TELE|nr:Zinc finger domain protein 2A [Triplophysa tibetana]
MDANNHFNYGPHSSVSANSGLKHSSGDSLYTNGSSMSFPQQGKNLNGDMNVNGITTAGGSGQSGAHPPSSSYPHMSNHHNPGGMGYDYMWGQSQYNPAIGPSHSMPQKPGSQGVIQPQQPQHHFQSHGAYQVNGSIGPSRQPPGSQYWARSIPVQGGSSVPMGYDSHSIITSSPTPFTPSPITTPAAQSQTQSQPQTQMIPPTPQSFTPPRGSPQQHHASSGGSSSPHHMQVPMRSPSSMHESGSPKSREMQGGAPPAGHFNTSSSSNLAFPGGLPSRLSPLKRPQEASPLTGQSPKHPAASSTPASDANNIDLSAHSLLLSSASTVTAAPPAVSSFPRAPTASASVSPAPKVSDSLTGSTAHYVDASENADVSSHKVRVEANHQTSQETLSKHEVCDSPGKARVISKQEPNNEAHGRNLEPAFIIPKNESISLVKKDRHNIKGQTTPGKGESDTYDDTFGTDTSVDYPSLAESSYLESSRVEGVSSMMDTFDDSFSLSQTEDPSKFTEGSMTDEASCVEENLNSSMTSTCSSGETSLRNTTSLLDDSFNESSQNNSSLLSASVNVSAQSIKGSPDSMTKKRKLTPDAPKEEKVRRRKKNEEKPPTATKKRKLSKEAKELDIVPVDMSSPSNALPHLPNDPMNFVHNLSMPNNESPLIKPKKIRKRKVKEGDKEAKSSKPVKNEVAKAKTEDEDGNDDANSSTAGDTPRRRVATEEQVQFPLQHGWRREIRVRRVEDRLKGETWYYSPCGRRMKQFPEIIKYLKKHQDNLQGVSREHFSFSPRMPVGDFYEERETPEGMKWFLLANEEVPSMIMAITGRRGRPPNPDKEPRSRVRRAKGQGRRPGRPPKAKMEDLLSKVDARLLKKLEAKVAEDLTGEEKEKLVKIKKKMKRKARMKRKEDAKNRKLRLEKKKAKLEKANEQNNEEQTFDKERPQVTPRKPGRRRKIPAVETVDLQKASPIKSVASARCKAKALAKAQAQAEAEAQAALAAKRQAERRAQAQRRMEERKRQQMILEEMKKPAEDMCLPDHTPLPALLRIPGLVLSGSAFSNCLRVVEFLHGYGKFLGLQVPKDIPSLSTLQEGLLGLEKSQGQLLDLLIKLMDAALHDPGLPSNNQSLKILGEKLVDLELSHSTVSEVLRVFLEAHGFESEVCNSLRTKSFQTLKADVKASILAFLVEELNGSNCITREIDNTLENMATYRKNKWIIEGKLRKLKAALVRKTGRPEEELCIEERRRSARVGMVEEESIEESSVLERGSRRKPKEEPKNSEIESPNNCSVAELERQIDKLTKRQQFFRKKLFQSSHSMRAVSLGQDRYRRRYLLLPYMGCLVVEGAEDILASGDVLVSDEPVSQVKSEVGSPVKAEVKVEPPLSPVLGTPQTSLAGSPPASQLSQSDVDFLPGQASLMSTTRGRGRPRKIKPEVELHLRTAKNRRRRRSSRSGGEDSGLNSPIQDLAQPPFHAFGDQPQDAAADSAPVTASGAGQGEDNSQPEDSMREQAEKAGQWFNLLPKEPCDETSLSQPCENSLTTPSAPAEDIPAPLGSAEPQPLSTQLQTAVPPPQVCSTPAPRAGRRRRRGSGPSRVHSRSSIAKRRGRPPSNLFQDVEQKYFTQLVVKPISLEMVKGWWWIREPEELTAILSALHPRGIREKVLHKHLTKHMEYLAEVCTRSVTDPIFEMTVEEGDALLEASKQTWNEQDRALQIDISVLQWVEDLELRVVGADLQLKIFTPPEPDSTREDLQYYEHEVDPRDDWMVRTKKDWSDLLRVPNNPLDQAVFRLTNLERNIERRYLKEPLWNLAEVIRLAPLTPPPGGEEVPLDAVSLESEITPRMRTWRQALDRCRSASQLSLCLMQLEKAVAWERSVVKVTCQVCRKGDDDEYLLLCDGCDRGCHMFCLKPKVMQVPEGDWFCPTCVAKHTGDEPRSRSARQRSKMRKRRLAEDSSDEDEGFKRGMTTRQKDNTASSSGTSISPSKRRRMTTRNQPDLTYCEIILMEMEAHSDAWPFLEPVNPRLVPGYRRIIKNPMDFLTMRERLLQGGYCSCEEFAADAQLVFSNCELFNEDTSDVGKAGYSMRRFFESRWAEFYENKDK